MSEEEAVAGQEVKALHGVEGLGEGEVQRGGDGGGGKRGGKCGEESGGHEPGVAGLGK